MTYFFNQPEFLKIPVNRAAYSDRSAWLMAECSRLAYENLKPNDERLLSGGFKLLQVFNDTLSGTYAYLAKRNDLAVLAFRGTEKNFDDIVTDLKIRFYETNSGKMHRGFYEAYQSVAADIERAVNQLNIPLYVTGHSLGGALAVIATAALAKDTIAACYTFGCPKIGDREFVEKNNKIPIYRVINHNDIITTVPFSAVFSYTGIGDIRYLTEDNELLYEREFEFFFNSLFYKKHLFPRHRINEYCQKLEIIAKKRALYKKLEVNFSAVPQAS